MEFEVPKRHISRPTLSTNMVQPDLRWRGKRGAMVKKRQGHIAENYCYNIFLWMFFLGKRREDPKKWSNLNFSQNYPFWAYIIRKKNQHIQFLVHGHSSWSTFGLHIVRTQKLCKLILLRNQTMTVGPWKKTIFHDLWCEPDLTLHVGTC